MKYIALALALLLPCCSGSGSSKLPHNPSKNGVGPGHFAVDWITDYSNADPNCVASIPNLVVPNVNPMQAAAENFAAQLTSTTSGRSPWSLSFEHSQTQVSAADFGNGVSSSNDAVFYAGHGDVGLALLPYCNESAAINQQYFGPGASSPSSNNGGTKRNINVVTGLKWLFLASSDSVTPPAGLVPNDNNPAYDGDWRPAFRSGPGSPGGLHGLYGAWEGPGTCSDTQTNMLPGRTCDISTYYIYQAGPKLGAYLWSNAQPIVVHDAWNDALVDSGFEVGSSEIEDQNNLTDTFTGTAGINPNPGGQHYNFSWLGSTNVGTPTRKAITPDTFALEPMWLTLESWNESNNVSRAQSYLGENVTTAAAGDGTRTHYTTASGLYGGHTNNSGAVVINAHSQSNPMAFTESQAQSYASSYIQNTLGMPSDAVLAATSIQNRYDFDSGTATTVGYVVTYLHQNSNVAGGDAIHVVVDDAVTYTNGSCLEYDWTSPDPPGKPMKYCASYQQIAHDNLNVSHMYRLWRTLNGYRTLESGGKSTGQQSIDAVTASHALPDVSAVSAYSPGYWTPSSEMDTGNGAEPAWLFTIGNDSIVAVDAFTGQILGTQSL